MSENKITVSYENFSDSVELKDLPEEFREKLLLLAKKKKIKTIDVFDCRDNNASFQHLIAYYHYKIQYVDNSIEKKKFRYYQEKWVREMIKRNKALGRKDCVRGFYPDTYPK